PADYDPSKNIQIYAGTAAPVPGEQTKKMCPSPSGGNNYWPSAYSQKTKLIYIPALTACAEVTQDPKLSVKIGDAMRGGTSKAIERYETELSAMDPLTGETKAKVRIPYPNYSGALATAGGLVRPEEPTSELQSRFDVVCRLLHEKKNTGNARGSRRGRERAG